MGPVGPTAPVAPVTPTQPAPMTQAEEEALIQKFLEQDKLNLVAQNANSDSSGVSS